jgi:hypothetical protein
MLEFGGVVPIVTARISPQTVIPIAIPFRPYITIPETGLMAPDGIFCTNLGGQNNMTGFDIFIHFYQPKTLVLCFNIYIYKKYVPGTILAPCFVIKFYIQYSTYQEHRAPTQTT